MSRRRVISLIRAQTSGASFIAKLPQQNSTVVEYNDEYYRLRLATLAAVDDLVDAMFERLEAMGLLDQRFQRDVILYG